METAWRIQMFGGLRAERGAHVVTRFRSQNIGALLAYLAFYRDRSHPREILIELLWPDSEPVAGRNNLKVALSSLRHQFEPPGTPAGSVLKADRSSVQVNPAAVRTDVAEFEEALQSAGVAGSDTERAQFLMEATKLYRGELLPGFYKDWILTEQRRLADLYFQAVRRLTAHFRQAREWEPALDYARRAIAVDPLREEAHRDLMQLLVAAGQPSEALRQYQELERILKEELDTTPAAGIRELARKIEASGGQYQVPSPAQPPAVGETPAPAAALPTGTVTFLLTEIDGAATLKRKAEDAFEEGVSAYNATLRDAFRRHDGHELKETGGAFTVAFERASDALACAIDCGRATATHAWPEQLGVLRVRMALDITEAKPRAGEAPGGLLRRATGLLLAARGGRILCSEAAAGLLRRNPESGVRLVALGMYRLQGLETPERLFAVEYPEMVPETFPPLDATRAHTSNLPMQFTRFFGREEELARLGEILPDEATRLVTLTGPGGSGKTRLAIEAARQLFESFQGAIWFVALQDVSTPRLIADAVLDALRVQRSPQVEPLDQAVEALSRQPSLLVLDNFEQLVDEGAEVVRSLLERTPTLTCVVTSRRCLDLTAEREFIVAPLPTPSGDDSPEAVMRWPSAELFVDRAQAVRPDFQVTKANARAVAELCHRLEGIPLALELAAARVQVLTPAQMVAELEHRFDFLVSRKRDMTQRHQTLRAAVEWSYRLLAPELQRFFARLSVFRGGWTAEAAEAVCEEPATLDFLQQLQESSLVVGEETGDESGPMRFRMLDTLREYAGEQLPSEDRELLGKRHAEWYLALAEEAAPKLAASNEVVWLDRLETEHDNLRAALEWCKSPEADSEIGLRITGALGRFWLMRGYLSEGRAHLAEVLTTKEAAEGTSIRGKALGYAATLSFRQGDFEEARSLYGEALEIYRKLGDKREVAGLLHNLALATMEQGDYATARALLGEALAINREIGNQDWEGRNLDSLGNLAFFEGDYPTARAFFEQSLAIHRESGNKWSIAGGLNNVAMVAGELGDHETARSLFREALGINRAIGNRTYEGINLINLGTEALSQADYEGARRLFHESLVIHRELGDRHGIAVILGSLARVCVAQRQHEQAARLFGAHEALREEMHTPIPPNERADYDRNVGAIRAALDEDTFVAAWAEGEAMTLDQAIEHAMSDED